MRVDYSRFVFGPLTGRVSWVKHSAPPSLPWTRSLLCPDVRVTVRRRTPTRRTRLQAGAQPLLVRASPTSRSRSRSSRSWPGVSPPSARASTTVDPIAISWGWPIVSVFILIIGFTMSELVSAYPTSGGIYWWASKMGGATRRLLHRLAQPDRPRRRDGLGRLRLRDLPRPDLEHVLGGLRRQLLADPGLLDRSSVVLVARVGAQHLQRPPDGDHEQRLGLVARRRCRDRRPDPRSSSPTTTRASSYVFTERFNNSGLQRRQQQLARCTGSWCVPFGLLLTQYTITGFDASAHLSEETAAASQGRGQGHLAVDLLLRHRRLDPAAVLPLRGAQRRRRQAGQRGVGGGGVAYIFTHAMDTQVGHGDPARSRRSGSSSARTSCMTSASRMTFAFSRDGAIPGSRLWSTLSASQGAGQRRDAGGRRGRADHPACPEGGQHRHGRGSVDRAGRLLRRRLGGRHRPLPRVPHPDLAAVADG